MRQEPPSPSSSPDAPPGPVFADASTVGVLEIAGADAAGFLQGQLSSDVAALAPGAGQWTSYNSPKGRMLANGWLWRDPAGGRFGFALASDLAEPIRKRLTMFVLRSKVTVTDATGRFARLGVGGPGAAEAVATALGLAEVPGSGRASGSEEVTAVGMDDGRWLLLSPPESAGALRARLAAKAASGDPDGWRRMGIRAGIGLVSAATQDLFVAQTLNWDAVGGISFRKGCYTGQEIIARTQYLGRLKERLHRFTTSAAPPAAATPVYGAAFGDQACGRVVDAVAGEGGRTELLAVVQVAAVEAGDLHLAAPDGPPLAPAALPYPLPDPAAPARPRV